MDPVKAFHLGLDFKKVEKEHLDFSNLLGILWNQQILSSESLTSFTRARPVPAFLSDLTLDVTSSLAQRLFPHSGTYRSEGKRSVVFQA